jgi:hypothetical protein
MFASPRLAQGVPAPEDVEEDKEVQGRAPPPPPHKAQQGSKKKLVIQLKKSKNDENSKILAQIDCLAALITDCPPTLESWLRRAVRVGSAAEI